jgi:hypothetical protein
MLRCRPQVALITNAQGTARSTYLSSARCKEVPKNSRTRGRARQRAGRVRYPDYTRERRRLALREYFTGFLRKRWLENNRPGAIDRSLR